MDKKLEETFDTSPLMLYRAKEGAYMTNLVASSYGGDEKKLKADLEEYKTAKFGNTPSLDKLLADGAGGMHARVISEFLRDKIRVANGETHDAQGKLTHFGRQQRKKQLSAEAGFTRERTQIKQKHATAGEREETRQYNKARAAFEAFWGPNSGEVFDEMKMAK